MACFKASGSASCLVAGLQLKVITCIGTIEERLLAPFRSQLLYLNSSISKYIYIIIHILSYI